MRECALITPVLHPYCQVFHSPVHCYRRRQCFACPKAQWAGLLYKDSRNCRWEIDICRSFTKPSDPAVLEWGQGIKTLPESPELAGKPDAQPLIALNTAVWESCGVSEAWGAASKWILISCLLNQFVSLQ